MSAAKINEKVDQAVILMEEGDLAGALGKLRAAKAYLATMPDARRASGELQWDRKAIDSLILDVRRQIGAADVKTSGIRRTNIDYVEASC